MPMHDSVVRYALLGILAALVVVIVLLINGPIMSVSFPPLCSDLGSDSRAPELRIGVQRVAATTCQRVSIPQAEPAPSTGPLRSPQGALGGTLSSIGGQPWEFDDLCEAGTLYDTNRGEWVEARMTLEFPVPAPASSTPIRRGTLSLYHVSGNGLDELALTGYPGDGHVDEADAAANGVPVRFAAGMLGYDDLDVTAQLTPEVIATGWVGVSIRADPPVLAGSGSGQSWGCIGDTNYPTLTIEYDLES